MGFFIKFSIALETWVKHFEWERPGKLVPMVFPWNRWLFPLDFHPVVYFSIWKMHGFSHQFPKAWEKAGKSIKWEKTGKLVPDKILQNPSYLENLGNWYSYFSKSKGAFFPLDSHPMVHFRICEIHGFSHQFPVAWENAVKSIELEELGKLVPIFPPNVWVLFYHQIPISWYSLAHGKRMAFPINF